MGLVPRLPLQRLGDFVEIHPFMFGGQIEPFADAVVQDVYAEQHHEKYRHDAEHQRAFTTSFVLMRDPGRSLARSIQIFQIKRTSMNPR